MCKSKLNLCTLIKIGHENNRTQQEIADFTGVNKSTVSRRLAKITKDMQHATKQQNSETPYKDSA